MTQGYWAIRLYVPFDERTTINFVGSFDHLGKRYLDDLIIFNGMYGIPGYLLWYAHKDLTTYNFSAYSIELRLFHNGDIEKGLYFTERYRIVDVRDDFSEDKKLIIALRETDMKLNALLVKADIGTLQYNETRTVEQLLYDVLEKTGIFPVMFDEHDDTEKQSIKFEYPRFTLDPSWIVRDFVCYLGNENNFEWGIKDGIIFIGPELHTYIELKSTRDWIDRSVDNLSKNYFTMKIGFSNTPLDILYHYELEQDDRVTDMRCIWVKHYVGSKGDTTKGCFVPVGRKINKEQYFYTLEDEMEKSLALRYLFWKVEYHPIMIGRIIEDTNEYAKVSLEKDKFNYAKKNPKDIKINTQTQVYSLEKVGRTTPYFDENAGLFFPITKNLLNNPNRIIFNPYNRIEQSVLGPFVLGNGNNLQIPLKGDNDLRLQLPNGWCLYVDENGKTMLQPTNTLTTTIPSEDSTKLQIILDPKTNDIIINRSQNSHIKLKTDGSIEIKKDASTKILIDVDNTIYLDSLNTINIGASSQNIQIGGASALTLSQSTHTHNTGNMGMPIPPPQVGNTIKLKSA